MTELSLKDCLSTEDVTILKSCKYWSCYIMNKELQWKDTLGYYRITYAHRGDKLLLSMQKNSYGQKKLTHFQCM